MSDAIRPQPGIMDIALYEGGKASVAGVTNILKLSSNENPFGASDKAKDAFARSVHQLHRYPSTDHLALRTAIAEVHGLDAARVICGVGSDEIIHFLCQAYAGPKDEVVFTEHGFLMYRISALAVGATPVEVAERERTTDVDAITLSMAQYAQQAGREQLAATALVIAVLSNTLVKTALVCMLGSAGLRQRLLWTCALVVLTAFLVLWAL